MELARILIAADAPVDLRFAAAVNRVDLLEEGTGHLYHPNPDTVLTAEQIVVEVLNFAAYSGALEAAVPVGA